MSATIVWYRNDLRITDHPALSAAVSRGHRVLPVFIWGPEEQGTWSPGAASRWWLHQSLKSLKEELHQFGSDLIIRQGDALTELGRLIDEHAVDAVYWNRCYEPASVKRDTQLKEQLKGKSLQVESFNGSLLFEPWEIETKTQGPYQVFTPFWKACLAKGAIPGTLPAPDQLPPLPEHVDVGSVDALGLLPRISWDTKFFDHWQPGESGAMQKLQGFLKKGILDYKRERDLPATLGTSRLSPHLHFGEISPKQVWNAVRERGLPFDAPGVKTYLAEIGWREFAYHILYHFPQTTDSPLRERFEKFPWITDESLFDRWKKGDTGYPIVDAGMRELWATGWMHNRVRMIVGSFLTKDLLIPWWRGARWFWDTLVDADLASNSMGWQWISGCGADAAPYFRIFNPVSQGEKFDPRGAYVRQWVPELAALPDKWLHHPWDAPESVLAGADVQLGVDYPEPIVDHGEARQLALQAFQQLKSAEG